MSGGTSVQAVTAPRLTVAFRSAPASKEADAVTDDAPFTGHRIVVLNRLLEPEKVTGAVVDERVWLNVFALQISHVRNTGTCTKSTADEHASAVVPREHEQRK